MFIAILFFVAFVCEFIDSSLGMGYGTTLTPILLILGYSPLVIVPALLMSEFIIGLFAAFMHHKIGNVSFDFRNDRNHRLVKKMRLLGYMPRSNASKIVLVLAACSLFGAAIAAVVAVNIPQFYLKLFIGVIVFSMGLLILLKRNSKTRFLMEEDRWAGCTGILQ